MAFCRRKRWGCCEQRKIAGHFCSPGTLRLDGEPDGASSYIIMNLKYSGEIYGTDDRLSLESNTSSVSCKRAASHESTRRNCSLPFLRGYRQWQSWARNTGLAASQ